MQMSNHLHLNISSSYFIIFSQNFFIKYSLEKVIYYIYVNLKPHFINYKNKVPVFLVLSDDLIIFIYL